MESKKKGIVLNYYDSLIYDFDMELLDGPHWLNDTIIGFYIEYLEKEVYSNISIAFIKPAIIHCLKYSDISDYPIFLDTLELKKMSFIILPLNDCEKPDEPGGSHWSLIVFSRPELTFFLLDSAKRDNNSDAEVLCSKISKYLKIPFNIKSLDSLQQTNTYDCGVFVLCNIDNIAKHAMISKKIEGVKKIQIHEVLRKRREIKLLIESLAKLDFVKFPS